jgi:predicted TIM-barrel fold metal-dependent hydrolase
MHPFGSARIFDAHMTAGPTALTHAAPEDLLRLMDRHSIERAMLSPVERWMAVDNHEGNTTIASWVKRWPTRFLGYASANPWYGVRAVEEIERSLDDGLVALKFHPGRQGFIVLEPLFAPLLERAALHGVPVYLVTGIEVDCMPLQVAELARRYPTVPFMLGRSGRGNFGLMDLLPTIKQAPNLFVETVYNFPDTLDQIVDAIGWKRIVFASDSPLTNLRLELEKLARVQIEPEALTAILSQNLARLLRLPEGERHCALR